MIKIKIPQKTQSFLLILLIITTVVGCDLFFDEIERFDVDSVTLKDIYKSGINSPEKIKKDINVYVDYSTCVVDARNNSSFFKALRPKIVGERPNLFAIKGSDIEFISSDIDITNQELNSLSEKNYANISGAVEAICNSNQQAILITDGEFWTNPEGERLDLPYMRENFQKWLQKGYVVHIIIEDYKESYNEKLNDKKRFYFFFTDDKLENNIYSIASNLLKNKELGVSIFKLTNSDIKIVRNTNVDENLQFRVDTIQSFDFLEIESAWDDIVEFVAEAVDDQGDNMPNGNPIINGLSIKSKELENFKIDEIELKAYNISKVYLDSLHDQKLSKDISDGFELDRELYISKGEIAIRITDKLYNELNSDTENLLRIDIVLKGVSKKLVDRDLFSWISLTKLPSRNTSIYESIQQTLNNPIINPKNQNKGIIHSIFIKTPEYNN